MLEQQLERLNTNIERLIAVFGNGTPVGVATAPAPTRLPETKKEAGTVAEAKPLSVHDVQAALVALARKTGRGPAAEILSAFGAARVADLKKSDYAAVMEKVREAWKTLPAEATKEAASE